MAIQLYWNDIEVGSEVTPLSKIASSRMLVMWAAASGDFNPLHYENTFASSQGVGKPIVHGQLKRAWLVQLLTDWMGEWGTLRNFSCQFRAMDYPRMMKTMVEPQDGETWWCKGKITKKYIESDEHLVECHVWVENGKGEKTTTGTAAIVLPVK